MNFIPDSQNCHLSNELFSLFFFCVFISPLFLLFSIIAYHFRQQFKNILILSSLSLLLPPYFAWCAHCSDIISLEFVVLAFKHHQNQGRRESEEKTELKEIVNREQMCFFSSALLESQRKRNSWISHSIFAHIGFNEIVFIAFRSSSFHSLAFEFWLMLWVSHSVSQPFKICEMSWDDLNSIPRNSRCRNSRFRVKKSVVVAKKVKTTFELDIFRVALRVQ